MQVRPGHGQNERWTEGPGTETEQSKDMETQGERWSQGGKPNARERGGGGRNQVMGETLLETGPETEIQEEGKRQRKEYGGKERRWHLCTWEVKISLSFFFRILIYLFFN